MALKKIKYVTEAELAALISGGTVEEGVDYRVKDADIVTDTKINGTSIVDANGVANIPKADGTNLGAIKSVKVDGTNVIDANGDANIPKSQGTNSFGVMALANNSGLEIYNSAGYLYLGNANSEGITARKAQMQGNYGPITTANFDLAVKTALCDGVGTAYSSSEQSAARTRIGAGTPHIVRVYNND